MSGTRLTKIQKEQLKNFYIDGMSVTDICSSLNISRDTFYYHKRAMLKKGIDLEEMRLANLRSQKNLAEKETEFLNTLIIAFESSIKDIEKIEDPEKKLETLTKYINAYYKLKAPKDIDCKQQVVEAISKTVYILSELAMDKNKPEILKFLHENSNLILEKVLKK